MKTQEILSIIALSLLGLCFLSGLVKMAMKKESHKKPYEQGCAASVFIAVVLLGISQLLTEEKYDTPCPALKYGGRCDGGKCCHPLGSQCGPKGTPWEKMGLCNGIEGAEKGCCSF